MNLKAHHNAVREILTEFLFDANDVTTLGAEDKACESLDKLYGQMWYERLIKQVDHEKVTWPDNSSNEYILAVVGNVYLKAVREAAKI